MANEFKVKKGLIVNGSGSTLLDIQGAQGQVFSVTDSLSGSLFGVSDISGVPIFEVLSDETIILGTSGSEAILISGSTATITSGVLSGSFSGSFVGDGSSLSGLSSGAVTAINNATANRLTTIASTTTQLDAEANLTFDGTNILHVNHTSGQLKLGADVSLFRDGANILRTDDAFHANANIHVGGDGKIFDRAGTNSFIHFDHTNSKIKIQEGGEEMVTIDSGTVTINQAQGNNKFKVFASSSSAHFFVSSSGMVVINNDTTDYFGASTRVQIASGNSSKGVGIRTNIFYLYGYGNGSTTQMIFGDGSANWGLFANDANFKLYDYSISGPALTVDDGGNYFKFLSGSLNITIGRDLSESTAEGRLKMYLRGNNAVLSTYHYNSSLELRAGISGSGYADNWSKIVLQDTHNATTGDIEFWTSGSQAARISHEGYLGIGATTPGAKLEVGGANAAIWINPADGAHAGLHFRQADAFKGFVGYNDSADVVNLSMDGSIVNGINVNSSHNVGIGTTVPKSGDKLFVKGGDLRVEGTSATSDLILDHNGQYSGSRIRGIRDEGNDGQDFGSSMLQFLTNDNSTTSATVAMTINSEGKVGIGSTDPAELLDVAGTARAATGIIEGHLYAGDSLQHWGDGGTGLFFPANDRIVLQTTSTERLRIDSSGIVTINDTGQQGWAGNKLNVGDTGDAASGINILTNATGNAYLLFSDVVDNSAAEYANQIRFAHDGMFLSTNIGGTEIMRLSGSGAVGIGTTTPATELDIFKDGGNATLRVRADGQSTIIIDSDADNTGTAGAYLSYRDTGATKWTLYKETNNDFYLYNAAATSYPIHAKAGGDIVFMEDGGNLGVGPGTPASRLDVSGSIRVHQSAASKYIEVFGGNSGNFIDSYANNLYIRYGGDTNKSIMLDSLGNLTFSSRAIFPSSAGSTASPTIAFPSHSTANHAGIYYDQNNQYLKFRAADGDRAWIGSAGIFSNSNVYSGTTGQFRNYGGVWKATTGTSGNGFNFSSADIPNAVTITGTASNILKITGSGTSTGIQIEKASGSSASTAMLTHLRQGNSTFYVSVDENQNGGKAFAVEISGSTRLSVNASRTYHYNTLNLRNRTTGNNPPEIQFDRDDSTTSNGNNLGAIVARGNDPSGYENGAQIKFKADGTWDSNDYPSRIEFATDQAGTMTNILVLDSNQSSSFTGNVTITGNLEVTGTTTTVNSTNLDLSDNIIGLNRGASSNANDSGIIVERGSTGNNAALIWDESEDSWKFGTTTATPDSTGNLSVAAAPFISNGFWTTTSAVSHWGGYNTVYGTLTWSSGFASIYSRADARLRLGSHNTQGVMVISSSKVGIGTETPHGSDTALHVHGGNILQSGSTANNLYIQDGSNVRGSNHLFLQGDASYVQVKSPGNALYLDAGAGQYFRNGSGTQYGHFRTNNYLFNTGSASTVGGSAFMTLNVGATTNKPISIVNDGTDGMYIRRYDSSGKYQIQTTSGGGNSGILSLQSYGGKVSIGTIDAPGQGNLEVRGIIKTSGSSNGFFLEGAAGSAGDEARIYLGVNSAYAGNTLGFMSGRSGSVHNNYEFRTGDNDTSSAVRLWISASGTVGIGTQVPVEKFTVAGGSIIATGSGNTSIIARSSGGWSGLQTVSSDAENAYLFFKDVSGERSRIWASSNNDLRFATNGGGSTALIIDSNKDAEFFGQTFSFGTSNATTTTLNLTATNTAGSPANAVQVIMTGYEGRGVGHFYLDTSYNNNEWFSGMRYSGGAANFQIGYSATGQAEYITSSLVNIHKSGVVTFSGSNSVHNSGSVIISNGQISISGDGTNATTLTESGNGDFTIAAVDDLRLQAGGEDIVLKGSSGTEFGRLSNSSGHTILRNTSNDKNITIKFKTGGSEYNGLIISASQNGTAYFNRNVHAGSGYSMFAAAFYDSSNSSYLLDPANTGTSLAVAGKAGLGGVTSPSKTLHVGGVGGSGGGIMISPSSGDAEIQFQDSGVTNAYITLEDGTQELRFRDDTANVLNINFSTERVGVGITAPSAKLHVSGTNDVALIEGSGSTILSVEGSQGQLFSVTDSLSGSLFAVSDISGIPILEVESNDAVTMGTFGANTLVVTGSRIGIGTADPSYPVHIYGNGSARFMVSSDVAVLGSTNFAIPAGRKLLLDGIGGHTYIEEESDSNLKIYVAGSERLNITNTVAQFAGEVEASTLDINGVSALDGKVTITDDDAGALTVRRASNTDQALYLRGGAGSGEGRVAAQYSLDLVSGLGGSNNYDLKLVTNAGTALQIDASNSNTSIFSGPLDVNSNADISGQLTVHNTSSISAQHVAIGSAGAANYLYLQGLGDTDKVYLGTHHNGMLDIHAQDATNFMSASVTMMTVSSSGKVGIGTTTPTVNLEVVGTGAPDIRVRDADGTNHYGDRGHNGGNTTYVSRKGTAYGSHTFYRSNGTSTTAVLTLDTSGHVSSSGNFKLADNKAISFGNDDDLNIYHDTTNGLITNELGQLIIQNNQSDGDIIFNGKDGSSAITALTLDMSDGGTAEFGSRVYFPEYLAHSGDPDTLFGFSGNDTFIINTAGTTALTIDSSQDATFAGNISVGGTIINMDTIYLQDTAGGRLGFNRNTSNGAIHNSGYNAFQLQVNTSGASGCLEVQAYNGAGTYGGSFLVDGSARPIINDRILHNGDTHSYFGFPGGDTFNIVLGGSERLRVDSSGNVGIGTTAPAVTTGITPRLDIVGGITHTAIRRKPIAWSASPAAGESGYYALLAKFDIDDANNTDLCAVYTISAEETSGVGCYARIMIKLRKGTSSSTLQVASLTILDIDGNVSDFGASDATSNAEMLEEDSFILKVISASDVRLYIKKKTTYGIVHLFEDSLSYENNLDSTDTTQITYYEDADWSASLPMTAGNTISSYMAATRAMHQFAFFTNTTSTRYLSLYSGFLTGNVSYNQRYVIPKPGKLVGMSIQANASRSNNTLRIYDADNPTSYSQMTSTSFSVTANRNTWVPLNLGLNMNGSALGDDNAIVFGINCSSSTTTNWNAVAVFQFN